VIPSGMGKRRIPLKTSTDPVDSLLAKPVEAETDLHGLDARSAEIKLESFLPRLAQTKPGAVVRIITGRGNRSESGPILKPLVRDLLDGPLAKYVQRYTIEAGGGAYLVQLR
jgi:DNA-nicking Smr family endonuclease